MAESDPFRALKARRSGYKSQARTALNKLTAMSLEELKLHFAVRNEAISSFLKQIRDIDQEIIELHISINGEDGLDDLTEAQQTALDDLHDQLTILKNKITPAPGVNHSGSILTSHSMANLGGHLPKLALKTFSGTSSDKFEFQNFITQFDNCVGAGGGMMTDAVKLTYLQSYLTDNALGIIRHLSINDQNYKVARELLETQYLDTDFLVDHLFKTLLSCFSAFDRNYDGFCMFMSKCQAILKNLQGHGVDLLEEDTAGLKLISHIIFEKIPASVKRELIAKAGNYPTLNDVFSLYAGAVTKLQILNQPKTSHKWDEGPFEKGHNWNSKKRFTNWSQPHNPPSTTPVTTAPVSVPAPAPVPTTVENFSTTALARNHHTDNLNCKFCSGPHSMARCDTYSSPQARVRQCEVLRLCKLCTSARHATSACYGRSGKLKYPCHKCGSKFHATPVCSANSGNVINSNFSTVHQYATYDDSRLLPVLSLPFFDSEGSEQWIRCLIDSGSQRSFLSEELVKALQGDQARSTSQFVINTFLGSAPREFAECKVNIGVTGRNLEQFDILAVPDFKIELNIPQLQQVVSNLKAIGCELAEGSLVEMGGQIPIMGIVGVDILQRFRKFEITSCMKGAAFATMEGLIPFGSINNFLLPEQMLPPNLSKSLDPLAEEPVANKKVPVPSIKDERLEYHVNFIMSPKKTYNTPMDTLFPDSNVEQGLEAMFSLDSLGHDEEIESDYDIVCVDKFKQGISYHDGKYHVELPWHEDIIPSVPSNHHVSLAVLNKVVRDLDKKNLLDSYEEVFRQQLADDIIEEIAVAPEDYNKYIWIPHRPVIKTEENVTTKIRPVFNCSLKTQGPSLNEAAYPGVNLMKELVQLSMNFRSNKFTLLSDVKQAFLNIRLAKEEDKNRFCFFMRFGNKLITFRYKTIIFGFTASPFILNYVLRHHASMYPADEVSHVIRDHLYVDNLIYTTNNPRCINNVYNEANKRLEEGGFCLRSWNTNDLNLRTVMEEQGKLALHGLPYEKVLGMRYLLESDSLQLSDVHLDSTANSKRSVLAQISKVFDPMGLYLPVTNRGRFMLRDLWAAKKDWDEEIPAETPLLQKWASHCADIGSLSTVFFPRSCVNEDAVNSLVIFTDASKAGYGFAVYNVVDGNANLLFAKSRVAPLKQKTLPTLELLGVHHALKSLHIVLKSFPKVKFTDVTIGVDSQIVLQWVLADKVNTKNIFSRNRIKDIKIYQKDVLEKYGINIQYRYVRSEDNPCDLLTRGLSFKDFANQLPLWKHGPSWLPKYQDSWPDYKLGCLSAVSQSQVAPRCIVNAAFNTTTLEQVEPVVDPKRYSSFRKAVSVATRVFTFIFKLRKSSENPSHAAKQHLFHQMQRESFQKEISYLSASDNKKPKDVPSLVNNLDLFLDEKGLVRSRGRIAKSLRVSYDIQNPIMLGKEHHLTSLIIQHYHLRCNHLGVQSTVNKMRTDGFWIPRMRQAVKNVLKDCITCQRMNSLAFRYPRMTNLPKHRVNFIRPFQHTGVDFTSHLWVKNNQGEMQKIYILLFTCLNIRAIHIELVPDMSTQQFVLAFTRFTNMYGIPSNLYSDNARSFVAGAEILQKALLSDEYKATFEIYGVKHMRIPLYSAWVGATWERLIRTVKSCLYKVVGRASMSYFELLTVISDIQNAINSRPLTYRSSENDLETITPSCFLKTSFYSSSIIRLNEKPIWEQEQPSRDEMVNTLSVRDENLAHFKELWYDSYLLSLRESCQELHQVDWTNKISVDDIVLVKVPNKSRPHWTLGRVLELVMGHDDKVRSVKIKRGDGNEVHHSINHLYPLELSLTPNAQFMERQAPHLENNDNVHQSEPRTPQENAQTESVRPSRAAAVAGRSKVQSWARVLN